METPPVQVGENRFVLNTGERFGAGGEIQTSTSVYGAIGQSLPTPPPEAIQEIAVNSAMYDASQGANSGAHISILTKSGSNGCTARSTRNIRAASSTRRRSFYNNDPAITQKVPFLNRNQFGAHRSAAPSRRISCSTSCLIRACASPTRPTPPARTRFRSPLPTTAARKASSTPSRALTEPPYPPARSAP
jgi:hypothetical protein